MGAPRTPRHTESVTRCNFIKSEPYSSLQYINNQKLLKGKRWFAILVGERIHQHCLFARHSCVGPRFLNLMLFIVFKLFTFRLQAVWHQVSFWFGVVWPAWSVSKASVVLARRRVNCFSQCATSMPNADRDYRNERVEY